VSTCWHGKEGFCSICYSITGDMHLKAVERNGKEKKKKDESKSCGYQQTGTDDKGSA
jgi:hypothetical protein